MFNLLNNGIKTTPPPAPVELAKIAPRTPIKLNNPNSFIPSNVIGESNNMTNQITIKGIMNLGLVKRRKLIKC
jgi:hypothetical protein